MSVPFTVSLAPNDTPPAVFAIVRLLKVVELVPPIACATEPFKLMVPVLALKVAPLLVKLRPTLIVVPAVKVAVPDKVKSRPTEMVLPDVAVALPCVRKSVATVKAAAGIVFVPEPLSTSVP